MISIIVLTYNSPWSKVYLTLLSILKQSNNSKSLIKEIIISDDSSIDDNYHNISNFFTTARYDSFIYNKNSENLGTVGNLLVASKIATGKYIKAIGAGDLLFSEETLSNVCQVMERNGSKISFGKMMAYNAGNKNFTLPQFHAPRNISPYLKCNDNKIKVNILVGNDWISGSTMFFERDYLLSQLKRIRNHVTYCEDLIQCLAVLDGVKINFINEYVIWYELGCGISTSANHKLNDRLANDHKQFFNFVHEEYANDDVLKIKKILDSSKERLSFMSIGRIFAKLLKLVFVRDGRLTSSNYYTDKQVGFLNSGSDFLSELKDTYIL
ncbi:glycosyltransferase [Aeromonas hydrophila]